MNHLPYTFTIAFVLVLTGALLLSSEKVVLSYTSEPVEGVEKVVHEIGVREVSSYTLGRVAETDDSPCIGAFNDNLCEIAKTTRVCASNEFPKGTKLIIGDGMECIVMDRMNKRYKNRIDIAELDYESSKRFGVQTLRVKVMK